MSERTTYAYAPDGVTAIKRRQRAPVTVRDPVTGRIASGVRVADLPRYGYYPERRETPPSYGNGIETDPVIDQEAGEAVYHARPVTESERLQRAKTQRSSLAQMARDNDLRSWVASDASGQMLLYDISPERRADYIGLPGLLDAADAADPASAPHSAMLTVRDINPTRDFQVPHTADQIRLLLQAGMGYIVFVYDTYQRRLDALQAATTLAEIEAVDIPENIL